MWLRRGHRTVTVATVVKLSVRFGLPDTPATDVRDRSGGNPAAVLAGFRRGFYQCLSARADALFESPTRSCALTGRRAAWSTCRSRRSTGPRAGTTMGA
jgi:hypothetical protein